MDAWQRCLERLEAEYPVGEVQTYVASLQPLMRGERFVLLAPNAYALEQVRSDYLPRIRELARHFLNVEEVHLEVGSLPPTRPLFPPGEPTPTQAPRATTNEASTTACFGGWPG